MRPRILHEPRLTVLCEVCTVLQALMVLDQPIDDETEDSEKNDELGRLHIRQPTIANGSARRANEAILQGSVGDTVRDTMLYADCPRSRLSI